MRKSGGATQRKVKRDFHQLSPTAFFNFVMTVKRCMTDNPNYPPELWGTSIAFLEHFFALMVQYEKAYHSARNYDRVMIRDRDRLAADLVVALDEMASFLEAASRRNPDALFTTGFNVTQDRRSTPRPKTDVPLTTLAAANRPETGKGSDSAS